MENGGAQEYQKTEFDDRGFQELTTSVGCVQRSATHHVYRQIHSGEFRFAAHTLLQNDNLACRVGSAVIRGVRIVKISGKCGIRTGETVSPVEIVRSERYGTPLKDAHRNRSPTLRRRSFRSQFWNLVFAPWPK